MAVAFDAKATAVTTGSGSTLNNANLTVGAGSNRALLVTMTYNQNAGQTISSMIWDAGASNQAMTKIAEKAQANNYVAIYGLLNPVSGKKTLTATLSVSAGFQSLFSNSFTGVDQSAVATSFYGAAVAGASASSTATINSPTLAAGDAAYNGLIEDGGTATFNRTSLYFDGGSGGGAQYFLPGAGAAVAMTATGFGSSDWGMCVCGILAAGGGAAFMPAGELAIMQAVNRAAVW